MHRATGIDGRMSARTGLWINALAYQCVWFAAVIGAGRGLWWPGVAAAALFIAAQLRVSRERGADLRLMLAALACGVALDGILAASGLARYAATADALSAAAPPWLLAIWASFALTLRRSLGVLLDRPLAAWCVGAIGGPLAYLGAARGWGAIVFAAPLLPALIALATGWSVALPLLTTLATRLHPRADARTASSSPSPTQGSSP